MKTAIIGSRVHPWTEQQIFNVLKEFEITEIISGGAQGIDWLGEKYGIANNIPRKIFKPDYNQYGKGAPLIRNKEIIDECEQVIVFQYNNSRGTEHAMNIAKEQGKKIFLYQSLT